MTPPDALFRHAGFVRALARRLVRDENDADDVAQQTWLAALRRPPRTDAPLRPWLATVVRNAARTLRRARSRRARREEAAARPEAVADAAERTRMVEAVAAAVAALDEPCRETVLLRFYEGLPPRVVAKRHGVSVETVRSRTRRAMRMLRGRLDREFGDRRAWCLPLAAFAAKKSEAAAVAALLLLAGGVTWRVATQDPAASPPPRGGTVESRDVPRAAPEEVVSAPAAATVVVHVLDEARRPVAGAQVGNATTGADGACVLPRPAAPTTLDVEHAGYARTAVSLRPDEGERWVRLTRGVEVRGRVIRADTGAPAVGAVATLRVDDGTKNNAEYAVDVAADGSVRWDRVRPGVLRVTADSPGFLTVEDVRLQIVAGSAPDGFVLRVVPTARVEVRFLSERGDSIRAVEVSYDLDGGITGAASVDDGVFVEEVPVGGAIAIEAQDGAGRRGTLRVSARENEPVITRDLVLEDPATHPASGTLRVEVLDEVSGEPVEGARVSYFFSAGMVGWTHEETAGAEGFAVLEGVPVGPLEFEVAARGHRPITAQVTVAAGAVAESRVLLARAPAVRGRVEGMDHAWVRLLRDGGKVAVQRAAEDGSFAFEGVEDGRYLLEAGRGWRRSELAMVHAGDEDVVVRTPPGGALELRAPEVAWIGLVLEWDGRIRETAVLEDGRGIFRLEDLPPGPMRLTARHRGRADAGPLHAEIEPGRTKVLDLDFGAPLPLLELRVVDDAGYPVPDLVVNVVREPDGEVLADWPDVPFRLVPWTGTDGRVFIPLPPDVRATAFVREAENARRTFLVPYEGRVAVELVVARRPRVTAVLEGGAAALAGLREGDVIETWNGRVVRDYRSLPAVLRAPVEIDITRDGAGRTLTLPPGRLGLEADDALRAP